MSLWVIEESTRQLRGTAATLASPYCEICEVALNSFAFRNAPAANSHHHAYAGGLAAHTWEVVRGCEKMCGPGVDRNVVITAAVWHDYAKIFEYGFKDGAIVDLPYRTDIGHIAGSFAEFVEVASALGLDGPATRRVAHCILAHHGRKEWGSPVEPATVEANIVHVADMMSARAGASSSAVAAAGENGGAT